jgi:sulfatase maturation enzyme AslB (radical SAM superfamily)
MGGETQLTSRFEQLVDHMIAHNRFDVCFSFVTNGTIFKPDLIKKLSKFRRVGIEVSVETVDEHNAYVRQGTDTATVLANIERYQSFCNASSITTAS